ncbi:MAG: hypothetical protein K9J13_07420, partial [Saprospiraceae bacterium]|nr:hypothetical protein [Saprospiraceae bacterium]
MKAKIILSIATISFILFSSSAFAVEKKISGYIYYGETQYVLDNVVVNLVNSQSIIVATTITNLLGYYEFTGVDYDEYTLVCSSSEEWYGCTILDANLVYEYLLNISPFDDLQYAAADVNDNGTIEFDDAQMIVDRYLETISSFPAGDWVFEKPALTVSPENKEVEKNIKGRNTGDTDDAYVPPTSKGMPGIYAINDKTIHANINTEVMIPIKFNEDVEITTLGLVITFSQNDIIVEDVISDLGGLQFSIKEGEVRIAWAGKGKATKIAANEEFIYLKVKTKNGIQINNAIRFNIEKISEISDTNGEKLYGVTMIIPEIKLYTLEAELNQNYPNPFVSTTNIQYRISESANVSITVINTIGQIVYKTENKS